MSEEIRQFDQADIEANKVLAILMIIFPILFFLVFVVDSMKNSAFSKFYANQALIMLILSIIPIGITQIAVLVCFIILLVGILNGSYMPIPFLGEKLVIIK
ncbi:MAG: hypothetical protein J6J52_03770 [Oscillospiraceae bacterium]|nr:hypothetical protein [Oscillospiraceae bacterium]